MRENTRVLMLLGLVAAFLAVMGAVSWFLMVEDEPSRAATPVERTFEEVSESQYEAANRAVGPSGLLEPAIQRFHLRMERYPANIEELVDQPTVGKDADRWNGPYVFNRELLTDPWGNLYRIQAPGARNTGSYDLWSIGPDEISGTSDDQGNW